MTDPLLAARRRMRGGAGRAVGVLLLAALTACGTQLDPDSVMETRGGPQQTAAVSAGQVLDTPVAAPLDEATSPDVVAGTAPVDSSAAAPQAVAPDQGAGGQQAAGADSEVADASAEDSTADCTDIPNQQGITDDTITIANVSDISGPVPGVFQAAQDATTAFAASINAGGGLCGRQLKVIALDSRADAGANQIAYAQACDQAFAAVGSMSVFDQGAATAGKCGLPDLHAVAVSPEAFNCPTCFGAAAINPGLQAGAMPKFVLEKYGDAAENVALLYVNINGVTAAAEGLAQAWRKTGVDITYMQPIDVAEFNYIAYVERMKELDVELVHYIGPYQFTIRLQQAMAQQKFEPVAFIQDQTIYDQKYVDEAGDVAEGTVVYGGHDLFTSPRNEEMQTYLAWLQQVKPGENPTPYGVYAWSAARLFADLVIKLGSELTQESLVRAIGQVDEWTGHGLTSPQYVGPKKTGECIKVIKLEGGVWKQISPGDYYCGPSIPIR